jgi:uracil phosphoribosyltransferase
MIVNLSLQYSILCDWISEIRDEQVQQDRSRFRRNLERIGEIAAFEISKGLSFEEKEIQTPGTAMQSAKQQPVLVPFCERAYPFTRGS